MTSGLTGINVISIWNITIITPVAITFLVAMLLTMATDDTTATLTLGPDDISPQLEVDLPNPILRESAGAIDTIMTDETMIIGWLAKSKAFVTYPVPDTTGNLIYISTYNITTGVYTTQYVPLGKYTFKDELRIAPSPTGGVHLFWMENGTLWDCRFDDGEVFDLVNTVVGNVSGYDIVARLNRIDLYAISSDGSSIQRSYRGVESSGPVEVVSLTGRIEDIAVEAMEDYDIIIIHERDSTGNDDHVKYLLVINGTLMDQGTLTTQLSDPLELDVVSSTDGTYSIALEEGTGDCIIHQLVRDTSTVSVSGQPINTTLYPTDEIQAVFGDHAIQVFSINLVSFPSIRKLQFYKIEPDTRSVTGPMNVTPVDDSPSENSFSVVSVDGEVYVVLAEQYYTSISKGYSKVIVFREGSVGFEPLVMLNPRSDFISSASSLDSITDPDGGHWVAATVSANGSTEIHIFMAQDLSKGELGLVASTPWWSTKSRMNCKLLYTDNRLHLVYEVAYWQDSRVDICLMSMDLFTNELSEEVVLETDLYIFFEMTTWDCHVMEPDYLVLTTMPMLRLLDMKRFEVDVWEKEPWIAIETPEPIYFFSQGSHGNSLFLFTLERRSERVDGLVREIKRSPSGVEVVATKKFLSGEYSQIPGITVGAISAYEYVISVLTDHYGVENKVNFVVFDTLTRNLSSNIDLLLPKSYRVYGRDIASMSNDHFLISLWGLDVVKLANEAQRVLELDLFIVNRTDYDNQSVAIPFSITGLGRGSIDIEPQLTLVAEEPLKCMVPFILYGVGSETNRMFSVGFDFLSPDLTPISPQNGSVTNNTLVEFSATPLGDLWESQTSYQVRVYMESDPDDPIHLSYWSAYPAHDLVLPSGIYEWKYVYRRFNTYVESDWTWTFTIDTFPPGVDAGGPYLNATIGVPMVMDASDSSDDTGIITYRWTILQEPKIVVDSVTPRLEYTPNRIGTISVILEVMDSAGNWARTSTVIFARPPPPELDVDIPQTIQEGREFSLVCTVTNSFPEVEYNYIWKVASWGGVSSEFILSLPDDGEYPLSLNVWDSFGQSASWSGSVIVQNLPPEVMALPDLTVHEFERLVVVGKVIDVPADRLVYIWTLDGEEISSTDTMVLNLDHGQYDVTLKVEDDEGGSDETSFAITALPWISHIYVQGSVNNSLRQLTVTWAHDIETDYSSVDVMVCADMDGMIQLMNFTTSDQNVRSHKFPLEGLPEAVYVYAVLSDNSLQNRSEGIEVAIPAELTPPHPEDDWKGNAFWYVLLLLLLSMAISVYVVYKDRRRQ